MPTSTPSPHYNHTEGVSERKETAVEIGILHAVRFSEILNLLRHIPSATFHNPEIDYSAHLVNALQELAIFLQNKSRRSEIIAFFESFETIKEINRKDILDFIELLDGLDDDAIPMGDDEPVMVYRRVEILRALFSAFGVVHKERVSGEEKAPTNPILNRYIASIENYNPPFYIDSERISDFRADAIEAQIFTELRANFDRSKLESLTSGEVTELPKEVIRLVADALVGADATSVEPKLLSKAQAGSIQRRIKAETANAIKDEDREKSKNQQSYEIELEKYQSLGLFIQGEFQRLQGFLLTEIPYVGEVLDFLSIEKQLRDTGILEGDMTVQEVTKQQRVLIEDLRKEISEATKNNNRLEGSIQSLNTELAQLNDDRTKNSRRIKEINQKITKASSKMQKNSGYISEWMTQIVELENRIKNIIEMLSGFRFTAGIPDIYEFEAGVYYSLRAGELYHMPEKVYRPPVTTQWIEENIVKILVKLLSYHLEYEGINIGDIQETLEKIKDLDPDYSDDVVFPDIEDMTQRRIKDFIDLLIRIIPKDYLEELPIFGEGKVKLVTPKIYIGNDPKIEPKKEALSNKQSSELRKDKINKRTVLIRELKETEKKLEGFVVFWRMRFYNLNKQKISIGKDLALIQEGLHWQMKNRGKTQEQLEQMLGERTEEISQVEKRLHDPSLDTDTDAYAKLDAIRTQQQRKIKNLR